MKFISLSLFVLVLAACTSAPVKNTERRPSSADAVPQTIAGTWTGFATYEDYAALNVYPYLCAKAKIVATASAQKCGANGSGTIHHIELSCEDDYVSKTGKAIYKMPMDVCETIEDHSTTARPGRRKFFMTTITGPAIPADADASLMINLNVIETERLTHNPYPGLAEILNLSVYSRKGNAQIKFELFRAPQN